MFKGQFLSSEFILACAIFLLIFSVIFLLWNTATNRIIDSEMVYQMDEVATNSIEKLVRTSGYPKDWENLSLVDMDNVSALGLATESRILDEEKILSFLYVMSNTSFINPCGPTVPNYECNKHFLGVEGYDFYFAITHLNGTVVTVQGRNCTTGLLPGDVSYMLSKTRNALLGKDIVRATLTIFYGEGSPLPAMPTFPISLVASANESWSTHDDTSYQFFNAQIQLSDDVYANVTDNITYEDALEITWGNLSIPLGATINSVVFKIEYHTSSWSSEPGSGFRDDFEVYDSGWVYITDWGGVSVSDTVWISPDVGGVIDSPAKANNIRIQLEYDPAGDGSVCYFDTANVTVVYTV